MNRLILIAHNLRSCHNVGSLLRTADGLGLSRVYLTGYTPYPLVKDDSRLPHIAKKITNQIHKTALGAENSQTWEQRDNLLSLLADLKRQGFLIAALEQAPNSQALPDFRPPGKMALIVGREVEGLEQDVLAACDVVLELPMRGSKESYNVSVAAAMACYQLTFLQQR